MPGGVVDGEGDGDGEVDGDGEDDADGDGDPEGDADADGVGLMVGADTSRLRVADGFGAGAGDRLAAAGDECEAGRWPIVSALTGGLECWFR
jgi:hypothetical protein